ncbi:MAG: RNHCP domain-containing protein [bacterium]|nr:RNHCP domain-containing protein [bacterium]
MAKTKNKKVKSKKKKANSGKRSLTNKKSSVTRGKKKISVKATSVSTRKNNSAGGKFSETKKFQRRKENFRCGYCGKNTDGTGYTNHCPKCLWSKHVDINPGDRQADCGALMEPVRVETKNGEHVIIHRCSECRTEKRNRMQDEDSFEAVIKVAERSGGLGIG